MVLHKVVDSHTQEEAEEEDHEMCKETLKLWEDMEWQTLDLALIVHHMLQHRCGSRKWATPMPLRVRIHQCLLLGPLQAKLHSLQFLLLPQEAHSTTMQVQLAVLPSRRALPLSLKQTSRCHSAKQG